MDRSIKSLSHESAASIRWHWMALPRAAAKVSAACCINALRYAKRSSSEKKTGVEWCWHVLAATSIKVSSILLAKSCNFEGWESIGPGVLGQSMLQQSRRDVVYARGWSCNAAYSDNPNTLMSRLNYSKLNSWKSVPIISHYIPIVFGQWPPFLLVKIKSFCHPGSTCRFLLESIQRLHTLAPVFLLLSQTKGCRAVGSLLLFQDSESWESAMNDQW